LHPLNRHDNWQIIPFFKGRAGSGKSTIGQIVKHFYQHQDVGILSNNCEKKFGLQSLLQKYIWVCLEMKKSMSLDQAEFQSMVSGEDVSVAVKNQLAVQLTWDSPGLLCGNEPPSYMDAQGSIARRMAVLNFPFSVRADDAVPDLLQLILERELAALILKCNCAYREICEQHAGSDIWKIMPQYFKEERKRFQMETDPLFGVIHDGSLYELYKTTRSANAAREDFYVPFEQILNDYKLRWKDAKGGTHPEELTPEKYGQCFEEAGLETSWCTKRWQGVKKEANYVLGIRPAARGSGA